MRAFDEKGPSRISYVYFTGSDFVKFRCATLVRLHAYKSRIDNTYLQLTYQGPVGSHACIRVTHFVPLLLRVPCPLHFGVHFGVLRMV